MPEAGKPFDLKINGFCEVVHAGLDGGGTPCLWMLVTPDKPEETWTYLVVTTGEEFDTKDWCHIKSFPMGALMWHVLRPAGQWKS